MVAYASGREACGFGRSRGRARAPAPLRADRRPGFPLPLPIQRIRAVDEPGVLVPPPEHLPGAVRRDDLVEGEGVGQRAHRPPRLVERDAPDRAVPARGPARCAGELDDRRARLLRGVEDPVGPLSADRAVQPREVAEVDRRPPVPALADQYSVPFLLRAAEEGADEPAAPAVDDPGPDDGGPDIL